MDQATAVKEAVEAKAAVERGTDEPRLNISIGADLKGEYFTLGNILLVNSHLSNERILQIINQEGLEKLERAQERGRW